MVVGASHYCHIHEREMEFKGRWICPEVDLDGTPCSLSHNAEAYVDAYLSAAQIAQDRKGPLFRSLDRERCLTERRLHRLEVLATIKRRARQAGLPYTTCCHTFRATGITTYLQNGGTIEHAQQIANHESPRTTKLYDRTSDAISLDEEEKSRFQRPNGSSVFRKVDVYIVRRRKEPHYEVEKRYAGINARDAKARALTARSFDSIASLFISNNPGGIDVSFVFGINNPRDIESYGNGFKVIGDVKGNVGPDNNRFNKRRLTSAPADSGYAAENMRRARNISIIVVCVSPVPPLPLSHTVRRTAERHR